MPYTYLDLILMTLGYTRNDVMGGIPGVDLFNPLVIDTMVFLMTHNTELGNHALGGINMHFLSLD
jgi:hypothetical protein